MENNFKRMIRTVAGWLVKEKKTISIILVSVVIVVLALVHLRLVSDTFYTDDDGNIHSSFEGYGDIPMHMTMIAKFAFSPNFDLNEPIFYGNKIQYHFLFNLFRGWLLALTDNWSFSVLGPAYLLVLLNLVLVFLIYRRFLKNKWLVLGALLLFFFGSGPSEWNVLLGHPLDRLITLTATFPEQNVVFGSVLSMSFIQQQSFFLGFSLFLLFVWCLLRSRGNPGRRYWIGAVIFLGCLPIAHMHSFIAATTVLFVEIIIHLNCRHFERVKKLLITGISVAVLALPQIVYLVISKGVLGSQTKFVNFRLGWMTGEGIGAAQFPTIVHSVFSWSYLDFLWINFGIILFLFVILAVFTFWQRDRIEETERKMIFLFVPASLVIFLAVQLIKFQPWDFDNNKLLVYFLFLAAPFIVWSLNRFLGRCVYLKIIILIVVIFLGTFSGLADTVFRYRFGQNKDNLPIIFTSDARKMADYVRNEIGEEGLILTDTTHLNPISSLAGRPVLVSYPGWLWSNGINYSKREAQVKNFYAAPSANDPLLDEFNIRYILLDSSVLSGSGAKIADFDQLFQREYEVGSYILYKRSR